MAKRSQRPPAGDKLAKHLSPPTPRELKARPALKGRGRVRASANVLPPKAPRHVYGYARVSTTQQADEGESLAVQQRQIEGYAKMQGLELAKVFVERGVSGSKPLGDRPEGRALLGLLQPGDVVITAKLDRMFRSALDALDVLAKLKDQAISLHMIDLGGDTTGNGVSKLVFTILSAVAEAERERTRERITEVKRDQHARGRFLGGARAPFGWGKVPDTRVLNGVTIVKGYTLEPIPGQQAAIRRMIELHDEGYSLRQIAQRIWDGMQIRISHAGVGNVLHAQAAAAHRAQEGVG